MEGGKRNSHFIEVVQHGHVVSKLCKKLHITCIVNHAKLHALMVTSNEENKQEKHCAKAALHEPYRIT